MGSTNYFKEKNYKFTNKFILTRDILQVILIITVLKNLPFIDCKKIL